MTSFTELSGVQPTETTLTQDRVNIVIGEASAVCSHSGLTQMNLVGNADRVNLFFYTCFDITLSKTNLQVARVRGYTDQRVSVNCWVNLWAFLKEILISHFFHPFIP